MFNFDTVVLANNQFWQSLYYQEVRRLSNFHVTFCPDADRAYYNAAHCVRDLDDLIVSQIETYFKSRELPSRIYLDHTNTEQDVKLLLKSGYTYIEDEDENWYVYDLTRVIETVVKGPGIIEECTGKATGAFKTDFVVVDAVANGLSEAMQLTLGRKLGQEPEVSRILHLMYLNGRAVATHATSVDGEYAFMAEGATLEEYRRRGYYKELVLLSMARAKAEGAKWLFVNCDKHAFSNHSCAALGFQYMTTRKLYELN
jgi:N-acetylglutamate synthase-like GNAT family acetyltransferase